ncbi:MAG: DUF2334 domain-containing protein [Candidatus Micrarchaeota archaeon]
MKEIAWPKNCKAALNINVDDVHPESASDIADCSGEQDEGVFRFLTLLGDEFPELKMTLFVTPEWRYKKFAGRWRRKLDFVFGSKYELWDETKFRLDLHPEWCSWLREKTRKGKFEIAVHGLNHYSPRYPYSAEFQGASYEESNAKLEKAEAIFADAKLPFVRGFRTPGWGVSSGLLQALKEREYEFVSCYPNARELSAVEGIVHVPQNWDATHLVAEARNIVKSGGLLSIKAHITKKYGSDRIANGLDEVSYAKIRKLLQDVYSWDVWFASMKEIAEFAKKELKL